MNIKNTIRAATLSVSMGLSSHFASAQETTITLPDGQQIEFDCGLLHFENNQTWMTKEAALALDEHFTGRKISSEGLTSKHDLSSDVKTRGNQLSKNLSLFLFHLANTHDHCVSQYARLEFIGSLKALIEKGRVDVPKNKNIGEFVNEITERVMNGELSSLEDSAIMLLANRQLLTYGANWQAKTNCILFSISNNCKPELGLD